MSQICPRCRTGTLYDDSEPMCPEDSGELIPYEPPQSAAGPAGSATDGARAAGGAGSADAGSSASPGSAAAWDRSVCWNCGTPVSHPDNTECRAAGCRKPLIPPAVVLRFAGGQIEVAPASSVVLGRLGVHAEVFRAHANVSRRHAVVGADPGGRAWIEPADTPNGTFLDDVEIPPTQRRVLPNGARLRFARDVEGTATVYAH